MNRPQRSRRERCSGAVRRPDARTLLTDRLQQVDAELARLADLASEREGLSAELARLRGTG